MAAGNDDFKIPKLNGENYHTWSIRAKAGLDQRNVWEAVDPGFSPGLLTEDNKRINSKALSFLFLIVEDNFLDDIGDCERAKEAWKILEEMHSKFGLLTTMHLMKDLFNVKLQNGENMKDYLNKVLELHRKLKRSGYGLSDKELALIMLMGLPDSYETLIISLEQQEEEICTVEVKKRLLLEEKRKLSRSEGDHSEATVLKTTKIRYGGQAGSDNSTPKMHQGTVGRRPQAEIRCYGCGQFGHIARKCPYNSHQHFFDKDGRTSSGNANKVTASDSEQDDDVHQAKIVVHKVLCMTGGGGSNERVWYVDSAATEHMSPHREKFAFLVPCNAKVQTAEGKLLEVIGMGTVTFRASPQNGGTSITLTGVLCVPELTDNLISLGKIIEKGKRVNFTETEAVICEKNGEVILRAMKHKRLFWVSENVVCAKKTVSVELLHRRLGHPSFDNIRKMKNILSGRSSDTATCVTCIEGKLKRRPFTSAESKSQRPLELVHSDIMGPIQPTSKGGNRYIITFIDDYSRFAWVYFMKMKNEAFEKFRSFKVLVEAQSGGKISVLRTDNGKEYVNGKFDVFLREQGIVHQLSVPYNPEQNGVAERFNQTVMNTTRCLLIESGVPKALWAEAVHSATYLYNRRITSMLDNSTPFKQWSGREPNYTKLKVFGCQAWALIPQQKRKSKLDARAEKCIFIGYPEDTKGYKLWDTAKDRFFISRDVYFDENRFPLRYQSVSIEQLEENNVFAFPQEENVGTMCTNNLETECDEAPEETDNHGCKELTTPQMDSTHDTVLRRSARLRKEKQCECENVHQCNQAIITEQKEPTTLQEALTSSEAKKWQEAIEREMCALMANDTWTVVTKPINAHVIDSKWVFKHKRDERGCVVEHKARLVARGFQQLPDIEYSDVFAPTVKVKSVRIIMAIAASRNWKVYHFDVSSAFLNGELEETVYMKLPVTSLNSTDDGNGRVCLLKKGLYGLRQGGRQWNKKINEFLVGAGLTQSKFDPCVYFDTSWEFLLGLHVDDITATCASDLLYKNFGDKLMKSFKSKDLGEVSHLLSMHIRRHVDGIITLNQKHLIEQLLKDYGMIDAKEADTPLTPGLKFKRSEESPNVRANIPYRQLIGALLYLANTTRPDISYATSYLSQFNDSFSDEQWKEAKHVLRYLKKTKDYSLSYTTCEGLQAYCDADWASNPIDRKSTSGYTFLLSGAAVSWCSRKQRSTALSSTEAEFLAMGQATKEMIWMRSFLQEIGAEEYFSNTPEIYADNQGAIQMANNKIISERNKHVEIQHFFIRERVEAGELKFKYIPGTSNVADMFTKSLPKIRIGMLRTKCGLLSLE